MFLLAVSTVLAQQAPQSPIFRQANRPVDGGQMALLSTNRALSLDVNIAAFRAVAAPAMTISDVPLAPGLTVDLELEEHNIFAPGANLVYGTERGEEPIRFTARFYKGKVKGDEKSDVFISIADRSVMGHVRTYDKSYEISTDYDVKTDGGIVAAISYPTDALPNDMSGCGVTDENVHDLASPSFYDDMEKLQGSRGHELAAAEQIEFAVEGAWEADVEFLGLFGGDQQAAADYAAQLIADVSSVYERDLKVQLVIRHLKIWTSPGGDYPYKEGSNMSVALRETREHWRKPAQDVIDRAFVHTFSGKPWTNPIGIAFLDVLCDKGRSGSYSAITRNNAARDRRVVAHEVGHNFSSPHTHDCGWGSQAPYNGAIHKCAPAEGGGCFTGTEQMVGTIMSYCSQSNLEFHPLVIERIRAKLQASTSGCIASARKLLIQPNLVIFAEALFQQPRDTILEAFYNNTGFGDIEVTGMDRSGDNNEQFEILEGDDVPFTIGPGASKRIKVRYKAESLEPATMVLTYTHNGFNPPVDVTFEGFAADATPSLAFVGADEDKVEWGVRFQGVANDTALTIKNFGTVSSVNPATLYVTDSRIEGPDRFDFEILEGTAPFQVRADDQGIPLVLRFKPTTTGNKEAVLIMESNAGGQPGHLDSLPLYGGSKVGPVMQIGIHDFIVDFGDVPSGGDPIEKEFQGFFANVGGSELVYTASLIITQGEPGIFTSTNFGLNTPLEPGEAHRLNVGIDPTPGDVDASVGLKRAFLDVWAQDSTETTDISRDTIHIVGNITASSSVPDDMEPDEYFYVTASPAIGGDLSFYLAPRSGEKNDLYILSVIDLGGREVYRRVNRFGESGEYHHLDARNWASGPYYIRVSTTDGIRGRKATVTK